MRIPYRVEIGFGSTWRTEPDEITWTDVTGFVADRRQAVDIARGSTVAWGETDPGELSLTLLNRDRRFDPEEPSSPYAGQLVAGVPIRVVAHWPWLGLYVDTWSDRWDGTSRVLYTGFIESWPQRFDRDDGFHVVPIRAVDGFEKLATARLPRTYLESILAPHRPYMPLGDQGVEMATHGLPRSGSYTAAPGRGEIITTLGAVHPATSFDGSYYGRLPDEWHQGLLILADIDADSVETGDLLTIAELSDWSRWGQPTISFEITRFWLGVRIMSAENRTCRLVARVGSPNERIWNEDVSPVFSYAEPFTAGWGRWTTTIGYNQDYRLYVNGEPQERFMVGGLEVSSLALGRAVWIGGTRRRNSLFPGWKGRLAHAVVGLTEPGGLDGHEFIDQAAAEYHDAVIGGLDMQRTGERLDWVLDQVGWPTGLRSVPFGRTRLGPANPDESAALDYARTLTATEDGDLFVAADGSLTFHDRWRRWLDPAATTPQIDLTGSTGVYFQDLDRDPQSTALMVNSATVTRDRGQPQTQTLDSSIDQHGERGASVRTLHRTDLSARRLARFQVNTRGEPMNLIPAVRVPLHGAPSASAVAFLSLELGDRVSVSHQSRGVGAPVEMDGIVQGIRHSISGAGTEWWCELYLAPAPKRSPFIIGQSLVGGSDVVVY